MQTAEVTAYRLNCYRDGLFQMTLEFYTKYDLEAVREEWLNGSTQGEIAMFIKRERIRLK